MPEQPRTDQHAVVERVADEAAVTVTRFWLAEIAKMEEQIDDGEARWSILKTAMRGIVAGH